MRVITTEYPLYNLWIQRPFELEGYAFTPAGGLAGYQERLRQLLASPEDAQTVDVVREALEGRAAPPAGLWEGGHAIDDYVILLSLGQGRNVHYREARWTAQEGERVVAQGILRQFTGRSLCRGEQAVSPFEVEPYLRSALDRIRTLDWLNNTGFSSGVFWYLESLAQANVELRYLSAWHGFMGIVRRYFQSEGKDQEEDHSPAAMVLAFRDAHEYDFVVDEHPPVWEELSRDLVLRHPRERYFSPRHAYIYARKLQLVLLLTLLDLLGTSDFARRPSLLRDIKR